MFGHPKCRHQWKLTGAVYQPRPVGVTHVKGLDGDRFDQFAYGSTLLTQECTECGWVSVSRVAGKPEVPGFVWADSKAAVKS